MTTRAKTSQRDLMRSILSTECPSCEGAKLGGCTFCQACYDKLPKGIQDRLANGIRSISGAIFDGLNFLENKG